MQTCSSFPHQPETSFMSRASGAQQHQQQQELPSRESHELTNCALSCVSPKCYSELYREAALEPGEIDLKFAKFTQCFYNRLPEHYTDNSY